MKLINTILLLLVPSLAFGEVIIPPPGLKPGDQYRLVYVTTAFTNATSKDIEFYNDFVTRWANEERSPLRELDLEWKAIASTLEVDAIDNTETNFTEDDPGLPLYGPNGVRVAPDYYHLWTYTEPINTMDAPIRSTQFGTLAGELLGQAFAWTGTDVSGRAAIFRGKIFALGEEQVVYGTALDVSPSAFFDSVSSPLASNRLYGMSEVLTVVPEPGSRGPLMIAIAAVLLARRRP